MPIFACRWPNGDLSIVSAKDRADAICRLDEVDNAETSEVFRVSNLLLNLRLGDDGKFSTADDELFGEVCGAEIIARAYPKLWGTIPSAGPDAGVAIEKAVREERERIGPVVPSVPIDPTLRSIKAATDMPDALLHRLKGRRDPSKR
jgi:hypothetical protein